LTAINGVGLLIVLGVVFDLQSVLGPEGRAGIYQRSLYPLLPAALTLGAAVAERSVKRATVSGVALGGYVGLLILVGVAGEMLIQGQAFALAGGIAVLVFGGLGLGLGRRAQQVTAAT
jgi:hypothetical protein